MVYKKFPDVVAAFVDQLEGVPEAELRRCAALAARSLDGVEGFEILSWRALMEPGLRREIPKTMQPEARVAARGIVSN